MAEGGDNHWAKQFAALVNNQNEIQQNQTALLAEVTRLLGAHQTQQVVQVNPEQRIEILSKMM